MNIDHQMLVVKVKRSLRLMHVIKLSTIQFKPFESHGLSNVCDVTSCRLH